MELSNDLELESQWLLCPSSTYITFLVVTSYVDFLASCHKGSVFSYPHLSPHHVSNVALERQQSYPLKIGPSFRSVLQNGAIHFISPLATSSAFPFCSWQRLQLSKGQIMTKVSGFLHVLTVWEATALAACVGPAVASALFALVSQGWASAGTPPRKTAS